jgi:hypothetical protein
MVTWFDSWIGSVSNVEFSEDWYHKQISIDGSVVLLELDLWSPQEDYSGLREYLELEFNIEKGNISVEMKDLWQCLI